MNQFPEMEVELISAAYEHRVRAALGGDFPHALLLRDRLDPCRWALEWNLPIWLGEAFALDPEVSAEIRLSNVVGLASIRLRDDLLDGDLPDSEFATSAEVISDALYEAAVDVYRHLFDQASVFWGELERRMTEWRSATVAASASTLDPGAVAPVASRSRLALRGAPLKISAFAVCLLAGRTEQFSALDVCLDHALEAMVLYDGVIDWREDLDAHRWNPFVAAVAPRHADFEPAGVTSADVQVGMMTSSAVRGYFSLIETEIVSASRLAEAIGVEGLGTHLRSLGADFGSQGSGLATRYEGLGARAQHVLFGNHQPVAA